MTMAAWAAIVYYRAAELGYHLLVDHRRWHQESLATDVQKRRFYFSEAACVAALPPPQPKWRRYGL